MENMRHKHGAIVDSSTSTTGNGETVKGTNCKNHLYISPTCFEEQGTPRYQYSPTCWSSQNLSHSPSAASSSSSEWLKQTRMPDLGVFFLVSWLPEANLSGFIGRSLFPCARAQSSDKPVFSVESTGFFVFLTLPTLCSSWERWLGTTGNLVNVTTCMKLSSSEPLVPRYADDVKLFVKLFEWDGLYSPLAWGLGSPPRWARSGAQGLSADGDPWCQGVKGQLMEEAGGSFGSWVSPVQNHVNSRAEESSNLGEKTATWMANTNKKPLLALARRSTGDRKRISHGRKAAGGTCCCCCNQGDSSKNVMKPTDFFVRQETCRERLIGLFFFCTSAEGFNTFRADRQTDTWWTSPPGTGKPAEQAPEAETTEHIPLWHCTDDRLATEQKKKQRKFPCWGFTDRWVVRAVWNHLSCKKKKKKHWTEFYRHLFSQVIFTRLLDSK